MFFFYCTAYSLQTPVSSPALHSSLVKRNLFAFCFHFVYLLCDKYTLSSLSIALNLLPKVLRPRSASKCKHSVNESLRGERLVINTTSTLGRPEMKFIRSAIVYISARCLKLYLVTAALISRTVYFWDSNVLNFHRDFFLNVFHFLLYSLLFFFSSILFVMV